MEYAAAPTAHADLCAPHAARWHLGPQYHTPRHRAHRKLAGAPHTSHAPAPPPPPAPAPASLGGGGGALDIGEFVT